MGIGKWIGGVLGFMAFGPLGALAGIILGSFFEEGANMTGQSFGGGTNYDDQYTRRDPYVPTGRSCIARWNTSVNSFGETSARSP